MQDSVGCGVVGVDEVDRALEMEGGMHFERFGFKSDLSLCFALVALAERCTIVSFFLFLEIICRILAINQLNKYILTSLLSYFTTDYVLN